VKMLIKMGPYVSKGFLQVQISNKYWNICIFDKIVVFTVKRYFSNAADVLTKKCKKIIIKTCDHSLDRRLIRLAKKTRFRRFRRIIRIGWAVPDKKFESWAFRNPSDSTRPAGPRSSRPTRSDSRTASTTFFTRCQSYDL
jgi:hypothetical protein